MAMVYTKPVHDFGIGVCRGCGAEFHRSGYSHLRCDKCSRAAKRGSLHRAKRKYRDRLQGPRQSCCIRCQTPFAENAHRATKRCLSCVIAVRNAAARAKRAANPEHHRAIGRKFAERYKQALALKRKRPEIKARIAEWQKQRRRNDPAYRVHSSMSRLIHLSLKGNKAGRRWETLVGYTRDELMRHLERQFTKRMTWKNMGRDGWHIDHILPRTLFDIRAAGDEEFRACWVLSNLRPLWQVENLSKKDKRLHLL